MKKTYLNRCFDEGYMAGEHSADYTDNPHQHGSAEFDAWEAGREQAEYDFMVSMCPLSSNTKYAAIAILCVCVICFGVYKILTA